MTTHDRTAAAADKTLNVLEHVVEDLMEQNRMLAHQNEELLQQNEHLVEENGDLAGENKMLVKKQKFEPVFKTFGVLKFIWVGITWVFRFF